MKIGDNDVQGTPRGQSIQCVRGCDDSAVSYFNGVPYCPECLHEEQQLKWNAESQFIETSEGERIYFEVVRSFKTGEFI
jgi:hypothetical protein